MNLKFKHILAPLLCLLLVGGCGGGSNGGGGSDDGADNGDDSGPPELEGCTLSEIEADMTSTLSVVDSSVDFSFALSRTDGREYRFERGSSRLETSYESASTSKLVTAVVILRLVEQGYLSLTDRPQDHINDWPIEESDTLYDINLAQLLSFTSGLTSEPLCMNFPGFDFEACVDNIANTNANNSIVPGEAFYYTGTHMQTCRLRGLWPLTLLVLRGGQMFFRLLRPKRACSQVQNMICLR